MLRKFQVQKSDADCMLSITLAGIAYLILKREVYGFIG